ncbi:glutamate ligase domain-containing protein [uncultured Erythrobacter sp.]|uniref:glutamate ligase domain-containing protein n=1 Tax=uncultured Erythrobacter sp. TaxID=263913 RepID=UPI002659380C|nr:Mur ligase family protein [uncultured Erythrobacter sp.]
MDIGLKAGTLTGRPLFFCGIGGSGMLPLAQIAQGLGLSVAGSDRSRDQGRTPEKFAWMEANGIALFPQDGSGVTSPDQVLVASAAIEDTVPEVARAKALGCERLSRAQLLSQMFNAADFSVAVAGTSGKSTVTGMIAWIFSEAGRDPTVMNGAVMKNFISPTNPFASARIGSRDLFVSEVDESDGSIALYRPSVGVLLNVSLDHKSIEELRVLFGDYLSASGTGVINLDSAEAGNLASRANAAVTFGVRARDADLTIDPDTIAQTDRGIEAVLIDKRHRETFALNVPMPGMHNLSNALAAIAAASAAGIDIAQAAFALRSFAGLARRFDVIGTSATGVTVIDDFGHNPEKCAATLRTLKATPGRVIAFFQPHGYGPLRQMGEELAQTFARELSPDDITIMCDPVYFGGTVDRGIGSERITELITVNGGNAEHIALRDECADRIVALAQPGDRIVVMGARDDTLTEFARSILTRLA